MKISVIGLGKLGSCLVGVLADRGYYIIGSDVRKEVVESIRKGRAPTPEPELKKYLRDNLDRIEVTTDNEYAVENSVLTFIVVPTPSNKDGSFSNEYIIDTLEDISSALKEKSSYHIISILSTVSPRSMKKFSELLEERTNRKRGQEFGLAYNPAFIAQGTIINDFLRPQIVLIGESDPVSGMFLSSLWDHATDTQPVISRTNWINAEIAKITLNCFCTVKISLTNQIAKICEQYEGANVDEVLGSINSDERIGSKLTTGGLGYGGPCFPRDTGAMQALADLDDNNIFSTVEEINNSIVPHILSFVKERASSESTIGALGLSFKPDTYITEESQAFEIVQELSKEYDVLSYDPQVGDSNCNTKEEVIDGSDILLVLMPWDEFSRIERDDIREGQIVYDAWRLLYDELKEYDNYYALGI